MLTLTPEAQAKLTQAIALLVTIGTTPAELNAILLASNLVEQVNDPDGLWVGEVPTASHLIGFLAEEAYESFTADLEDASTFVVGFPSEA